MSGVSLITHDRLVIIDRLARETCSLPGTMAELGVYLGGSAIVIADACPGKTLHLFDTWLGLPADGGEHKAGEFYCTMEDTIATIGCRNVMYHVGRFPGTVEPFVRYNSMFSFVHIDADLYESTRDAIAFFLPRMALGGVMVFDDVDWHKCPGVNQALEEAGLMDKIGRMADHQGIYRNL